MLHNLRFFFSSKCRLFHNATLFGPCIIRKNLNVKFRLQKVNQLVFVMEVDFVLSELM